MSDLWTCPKCGRVFRRPQQAHSCDVGRREDVIDGRPEALVKLYLALEKAIRASPDVEIVYTRRCALFRTTRVFADLVFMADALRLALLLDRKVEDPRFFKVGAMSTHRIAHVTKIRTATELRGTMPYLREALEHARSEGMGAGVRRRERAGEPARDDMPRREWAGAVERGRESADAEERGRKAAADERKRENSRAGGRKRRASLGGRKRRASLGGRKRRA